MASKTLLLLCLFALLLIVSEVVRASRTQSGMKPEREETVQADQYDGGQGQGGYNGGGHSGYNGGRGREGGHCYHGCCYRGFLSCIRCCSYPGEAVQTQPRH